MKLEGFVIKEIEVGNAIILCYKDYKMAKITYDRFEEEKYNQGMHTRVRLRFLWSPEEEYQCKIVVEFINRNKDVCANPPKLPFEGSDLDEFQELTFMNSVGIEDCKISYSGDVPKIR